MHKLFAQSKAFSWKVVKGLSSWWAEVFIFLKQAVIHQLLANPVDVLPVVEPLDQIDEVTHGEVAEGAEMFKDDGLCVWEHKILEKLYLGSALVVWFGLRI